MRSSPGYYAFSVRASTEDELHRIVSHMRLVGQDRIAVLYQDDPFGRTGLSAAQSVLRKLEITPVALISVVQDGSNADDVVFTLKSSGANGIILIASPVATVEVILKTRFSGSSIQFYNLAAQANRKVIGDLGQHVNGVVFTTLVPSPWRDGIPAVKDYQQVVLTKTGKAEFSYLGMELFVNAQILLEGLRFAGPKVTRESLIAALESMGEKSFGNQMRVRYGVGDRKGSSYVGLAIIGRDGRFIE